MPIKYEILYISIAMQRVRREVRDGSRKDRREGEEAKRKGETYMNLKFKLGRIVSW